MIHCIFCGRVICDREDINSIKDCDEMIDPSKCNICKVSYSWDFRLDCLCTNCVKKKYDELTQEEKDKVLINEI